MVYLMQSGLLEGESMPVFNLHNAIVRLLILLYRHKFPQNIVYGQTRMNGFLKSNKCVNISIFKHSFIHQTALAVAVTRMDRINRALSSHIACKLSK